MDDSEQHRADQIALHFYTKLFHVVYQARAFPGELYQETVSRDSRDYRDRDRPPQRAKVDRWFNLEIPDSDLFPRELREIYRSLSSLLATSNNLRPSPPLRIHVLLLVPDNNNNNQVLVTLAQSNSPHHTRILIEPTPKYVLLETWKMQFVPNPDLIAQLHHPPTDVALPTIYKHAIPLFRSLYSLLRILPAWKLFKKLRRRTYSAAQFAIQLRATEGGSGGGGGGSGGGDDDDDDDDGMFTSHDESVLGFDKPPASGHPPLPTLTHVFPPIPHPLGSFTLSATYLESPTFQLDDRESLLSSKFKSLDEGGFVPTLATTTTTTTTTTATTTTGATTAHSAAVAAGMGYHPKQQQRLTTQVHPHETIASRFVIPTSSSSPSTTAGGQGQGHFSHLRQPSLLHQHQHHRHWSDSSYPSAGNSGNSPPPTVPVPLPAALSRLRLESNNHYHHHHPSSSSSSSPSHRPPSLLLMSPTTTTTTTSHSPSPSPTSKSPFFFSSPRTPPQNTIPLPPLHSLNSLPSLPSLPPLPLSVLSPISTSSSSPTATQAMPIKRPSTINPFKANTLGTSNSSIGGGGGGGVAAGVGAGAAGAAGGGSGQPGSAGSIHSIHSIYSHSGSIASLRQTTNTAFPQGKGGGGGGGRELSRSPPQHLLPLLPFPTSSSGKLPSSPTSSPGPTFQKLGASGSGHGAVGAEVGLLGMPGPRKRYSSSFTHRYAGSGSGGSVGSAGSEGREGKEGKGLEIVPISVPESSGSGSPARGGGGGLSSSPLARGTTDEKSNSRSSSFLGKRTEDDDISLFMQDIETRKPLSGRWKMELGGVEGTMPPQVHVHQRERTDGTDGTDRTVRAEGGSSVASEGTMTVGGDEDGEGDEEGDEEGEGEGEGEGLESRKQRYPYPNQPSPLSPHHPRYRGHAEREDRTSPPGAIPTSQAEVEMRLKKMNEVFSKSLAGLDDGAATWRGRGRAGPATSTAAAGGGGGTSAFQVRKREGERLMRLMRQQGSEEVIGAIELSGSGGREPSDGRDGR